MPLEEQTVERIYDLLGFARTPKGTRRIVAYTNFVASVLFWNRVVGTDNLDVLVTEAQRPIGFLSTHVHELDQHIVGAHIHNYLRRRFGGDLVEVYKNIPWFIARRDLLNRGPIIKGVVERSPSLLIEDDAKNNPLGVVRDLMAIKKHLDEGKNIVGCPQGRRYDPLNPPRNKRGEIDTVHPLDYCIDIMAWILYNVNPETPPLIIPVCVDGLEGLTKSDLKHPKSRVVTTIFGEPFELDPSFDPPVKGLDYITGNPMIRFRNRKPYEEESRRLLHYALDLKPA